LAFSISIDLREAALNIRKQFYSVYEISPVSLLVEDDLVNILLNPVQDTRGSGFLPLRSVGLTEEALKVMLDMVNLNILEQAYTQYTLMDPCLLSLMSIRY
jgi:hypothetical protein